ncbi:hypothetical protein HII12_002956 [Brettanomyces bruxellensis]|uniref:Utp14p n=1 Tax=Dekkera bruxellensis TaxID=5007 RepID=A0A8H6BF77_DEKBR|nr:hypothetical protein HII12_002956 [Brettanomyces bruxellensis]
MGRKNKSKSKSHRSRADYRQRAMNAYEQATIEEEKTSKGRGDKFSDTDESEDDNVQTKYEDTIIDARALLKEGKSEGISKDDFEDEEIDSDEAFGTDEEYEDEILDNGEFSEDLDDDENLQYDHVNKDELLPLSAIWEEDDKELVKEKVTDKMKKIIEDGGKQEDIILDENISSSEDESEIDSYNSSSEEEAEDQEEENPFDEIDETAEDTKPLKNVISTLEKAAPKEGKKLSSLVNDTSKDSQYSLPTTGTSISFADMLAGVSEAKDQTLLINTETPQEGKEESDIKNGETVNGAFAIPLPQSIEKRQERKAAYDIQKRNAPLNKLETKLEQVIKASNSESKKTEDVFEKIETAKISKADLIKRTNELRLMRELMYRGQKDSKRLKRIKSKAYRRIMKKERLKNKRLAEEAEGITEDAEEDAYERAKERMTLKHKNNSSWARKMIKSGMSKDSESREEMEEMMRREASLQIEELRNIQEGGATKVFKEKANAVNVNLNSGRRIYTPQAAVAAEHLNKGMEKVAKEVEDDESRDLDHRLRKNVSAQNLKLKQTRRQKGANDVTQEANVHKSENQNQSDSNDEFNPWMDAEEDITDKTGHHSSKIQVVDKNSSKTVKAAAKIEKKRLKEMERRKRKSHEDTSADVQIADKSTIKIIGFKKRKTSDDDDDDDDDRLHTFKQKDLIRDAFAGDDVIEEEFEAEKKEVEDFEDDKEVVEDTLPGWGSWTGDDESTNKNKRGKGKKGRWGKREPKTTIVEGVVSRNKRKDKNRKNVIINERVNKKNEKYLADKVPYPYKTWAQYERSLRTPLGQDWNSKSTYRKINTPAVITKFGDVINPLKVPTKKE